MRRSNFGNSDLMSTDLKILFKDISELQDSCSMQCEKTSACDSTCCSMSTMGGEPSVTEDEAKLINAYLKSIGSFAFYESGRDSCKFLGANGRCKIYTVRPIDCRIHFCASNRMESQDNDAVDGLVSDYHERHEASFYNASLIDSCKFHLEEVL